MPLHHSRVSQTHQRKSGGLLLAYAARAPHPATTAARRQDPDDVSDNLLLNKGS